ncbi:MAG TPA: response regulator transcription factor, partial [Puia sp.]|nr:response regulator transcription factor [Puia sp.]
MVRVFITDDHEIYLEGLSLLLGKQDDIAVIGTAATGQQLLGQIQGLQVDILLLDVYLPDIGEEELLQQIRAIRPELKIIYLTLLRGTRYIHKLTKHTIQGYVLKNASLDELLCALRTVGDGGSYFSKDVHI